MLISQLIDPRILFRLNPRQIEVLNSIALTEVISSPTIKKELADKVNLAIKAMSQLEADSDNFLDK